MIAGSVIGAWSLTALHTRTFDLVFGAACLPLAGWFLFGPPPQTRDQAGVPHFASAADLAVGTFAGFCGGFIGINAPPLLLHFGRVLDKRHLRRLLVLIFIPAAIAQTGTFVWRGEVTRITVLLTISILPAMVAGIGLGNRAFVRISEQTFRRVLGALLLVIGLRLLWASW